MGRQLQTRATYRSERGDSGKRYGGYYMGEGQLHVNTTERVAVFQDGEQLTLLRPEFNIETPTNSPAPAEMSVRIAPSLIGLSLLERIPDARLETLEDPKDANRDGVSGRIHWRTDTAGEPAPGRFGWKASHVSVASQTAVAFAEDIGITNPMERKQNCSEQQLDCLAQRHGADATEGVEVPGLLFDKVVFFTGNMAPPPAGALTPKVRLGQRMFSRAGCDSCHTPSHTLTVENADGESSSETIWPYTDLLLHDMGELLADSMHDGLAASGEWRTSPLWGLGLSLTVNETTGLLHDGRARTVAEAVAWHGGEGQDARDRFFDLNEKQRAALEAFVLAL
ncbi:MAG: di-heme oxidoredictase family protein [Pseudomonadota bacterium]